MFRPSEAAAQLADSYTGLTAGQAGLGVEALSSPYGMELAALATRAAEVVTGIREDLKKNEQAAATFFGSYMPSLLAARKAAYDIALTQGEFTTLDEASLANAGTGLADIRSYLRPFTFAEQAGMPSDMPALAVATLPRLRGAGYCGGDAYMSVPSARFSLVDPRTHWPTYAAQTSVPVLLDPHRYTLNEFAALPEEGADGYAQQVLDTWRSVRESHEDHPSYTGRPLVVRTAAVLPTPPAGEQPEGRYDYAIDFLPEIGKSTADIAARVKRAYDVQLLVKGNKNVGGNYLKFEYGAHTLPIYVDADGERAPLTVKRGEEIADDVRTLDDLTLTPRSQGALALFMAPHVIKEKEYGSASETVWPWHHPSGGTPVIFPLDPPLQKGLASAQVDVGPGSWVSSAKQTEGLLHRVAPELLARPIIISMQLFTFQR